MNRKSQPPAAGEAAHWKLVRGAVSLGIEFDDGVSPVRHVAWLRTDNEHQAKDSTFIVRACNSHAALVERLTALVQYEERRIAGIEAGEPVDPAPDFGPLKVELYEARAALEQAAAN